jgi:hypothetical protein
MSDHLCPVVAGAGGLIADSWCLDRMAEVLVGMPPIVTEADVLCPELVLFEKGRLTVRYCPFDGVNPEAKLVIVGITTGLPRSTTSFDRRANRRGRYSSG